jgi:hypothetical protein
MTPDARRPTPDDNRHPVAPPTTTGPRFATIESVVAVVLRGPANTAPESIVGPFASMTEAEEWARAHPREGGYCIAEPVTDPAEIA